MKNKTELNSQNVGTHEQRSSVPECFPINSRVGTEFYFSKKWKRANARGKTASLNDSLLVYLHTQTVSWTSLVAPSWFRSLLVHRYQRWLSSCQLDSSPCNSCSRRIESSPRWCRSEWTRGYVWPLQRDSSRSSRRIPEGWVPALPFRFVATWSANLTMLETPSQPKNATFVLVEGKNKGTRKESEREIKEREKTRMVRRKVTTKTIGRHILSISWVTECRYPEYR